MVVKRGQKYPSFSTITITTLSIFARAKILSIKIANVSAENSKARLL